MNAEEFWAIVEDSRREAGSDTERVAQAVLRRLRALDPGDLEPFQELWEQAQDEVYRWPILDAATLLLGPVVDVLAVQDWILSHGRETIRRVQDDPDTLVTLAADRHNARIDWFCGLPMDAHISATGAPFPVGGSEGLMEPLGTPIDLTDETAARRHFPRLTAYLDDNRWIPRPWDDPSG